ncbi:MAG TPA: hypothetical protein VJ438_05980 [Candidatus Nanoarchaeia archaeon]|nr:hypothetical protein [Candidatus Nanoarchaeia archaeon]
MTKHECIVYDEASERDVFKLSNGNLEVLKKIPEMMTKSKWRIKLRMLVLDYIMEDVHKDMKRSIKRVKNGTINK